MKATTLGKQILVALLATRERPNRYCGICANVHNNYTPDSDAYEPTGEDISKLVTLYARHWPKYSGVPLYPVPHPSLSAEDAYDLTENMWDRETEYGRNRWELLEFIIAEVEKELQEDGS